MGLGDLDVAALGERVKSLYGEDVYKVTLQRALVMATRNTIAAAAESNEVSPEARPGIDSIETALTSEAVLSALQTEFLRLVRPH
jgi:hypothetical protein